jgi:uncharacterized membrane protein YccC
MSQTARLVDSETQVARMRKMAAVMLTLPPGPPRVRLAARAALCAAVPVIVGQTTGYPALGLVGSLGSLAAVYGANATARREAGVVGAVGVGLAASMAVGAAVAGYTLMAVVVVALWAGVATVVCALTESRPPGMMMFVLVCAVGSGLPAGHVLEFVLAVLAAGVFSSAVTFGDQSLRRRQSRNVPGRPSAARRWRSELTTLPRSATPLVALRSFTAVLMSGLAALLLHDDHPYWAMTTAAAVLTMGSYAAIANKRALLRGAGTLLGCILAGGLLLAHPRGLAVALLLAALTFLVESCVARNYAVAMIFVAPMSVILVDAAGPPLDVIPASESYLLGTLIGCVAAMTVGQLATRGWVVRQRSRAIAETLLAVATTLECATGVASAPNPSEALTTLERARARLARVSERTTGERRGVRQAVRALDATAEQTEQLAAIVAQVVRPPCMTSTDAIQAVSTLRYVATQLLNPRRPATPPPLSAAQRDFRTAALTRLIKAVELSTSAKAASPLTSSDNDFG